MFFRRPSAQTSCPVYEGRETRRPNYWLSAFLGNMQLQVGVAIRISAALLTSLFGSKKPLFLSMVATGMDALDVSAYQSRISTSGHANLTTTNGVIDESLESYVPTVGTLFVYGSAGSKTRQRFCRGSVGRWGCRHKAP